MPNKAALLTLGLFSTSDAKTAHGLVRSSEYYDIVCVIDPPLAGRDAGEVLDGRRRGIPVAADLDSALQLFPDLEWLIIGVATVGGVLPVEMLPILEKALENGLNIVNGLHDYLGDRAVFVELARRNNARLIDLRKPKKPAELHFWTGQILQEKTPVIAVLGMDCAIGKRTACRMLRDACRTAGIRTEMIHTGQTGALQGGQYGFILDATPNDFVSGELEYWILRCIREQSPDLILLEGQSALRNPAGPCGAEMLLSGGARRVVLMHAPKRRYFEHDPAWGEIPDVESEIALIKAYGSEVIALGLHTEDCSAEEVGTFQAIYEQKLKIPVILPLEEGFDRIIPAIKTVCS